jgi:hypothetical protein
VAPGSPVWARVELVWHIDVQISIGPVRGRPDCVVGNSAWLQRLDGALGGPLLSDREDSSAHTRSRLPRCGHRVDTAGAPASGWNLRGAWRSVQVMFDGPKKDLPPGAFDMTKPLYLVVIGALLLSLAS